MVLRALHTFDGWRAGLSGLLLAAVVCSGAAFAQEPTEAQRAFESGKYQEVVDAAAASSTPSTLFLGALSAQKIGDTPRANAFLEQLAQLPESDAWHFVGVSARQLLAGDDQGAFEAAQRATATDPALSEARYALGLVLVKRQDWGGAAGAFDEASRLNPSFAHASYYAGLSHYRASRPDLMAARFERFLKLAPDAPERAEVQQIMRTVRGR